MKEEGYAVDDEEYIPGVRAVAAPLLFASPPPAALWVVGFTSTMDNQENENGDPRDSGNNPGD